VRHITVVKGNISIASKKGKLFTKAEVLMTESAGKVACLMRHKHFWNERLQSLRGGARRKKKALTG